MKKFVSLFLVAVLCIAVLPLQAFAAEDHVHSEECSHVEHSKGCSHPVIIVEQTDPDGYMIVGNDGHKQRYKNSGTCAICHKPAVKYTYGALQAHNWSIYAASCDGTMQTLQYHCRTCGGGHKSDPKPCPAGPHTGGCPVLPV